MASEATGDQTLQTFHFQRIGARVIKRDNSAVLGKEKNQNPSNETGIGSVINYLETMKPPLLRHEFILSVDGP